MRSSGSVGLLSSDLGAEVVMTEDGDQELVIQTVLLHCNSPDRTDRDVSTSLISGTGGDATASESVQIF